MARCINQCQLVLERGDGARIVVCEIKNNVNGYSALDAARLLLAIADACRKAGNYDPFEHGWTPTKERLEATERKAGE